MKLALRLSAFPSQRDSSNRVRYGEGVDRLKCSHEHPGYWDLSTSHSQTRHALALTLNRQGTQNQNENQRHPYQNRVWDRGHRGACERTEPSRWARLMQPLTSGLGPGTGRPSSQAWLCSASRRPHRRTDWGRGPFAAGILSGTRSGQSPAVLGFEKGLMKDDGTRPGVFPPDAVFRVNPQVPIPDVKLRCGDRPSPPGRKGDAVPSETRSLQQGSSLLGLLKRPP